ncbi:hypothetical protein [Actinoalloteichus hymeniacidonis]|uniref:Uncharacterized protein n=1 Tax=Actinoalloteichus hymeniacidonis TaxID=340345 RepID=A0AAC9HSU8_9PSEU|nr:hypothetical protein [Actinoalloteichus hymeniacidonis]AOS64735.1 hypothetical protein TL08_19720 [Actinoalloteichus hymeniacidonis]MBB5907189.1 hypothetical protein [Actinoalloteichus hymeniacidonis]
MTSCTSCGDSISAGSGKLCSLCIAKMVNYMEGDYDDDNDPAVKHLKKTIDGPSASRGSTQSGCAVVALAVAAVPALFTAGWLAVANLFG